jgi:hypothetical protein
LVVLALFIEDNGARFSLREKLSAKLTDEGFECLSVKRAAPHPTAFSATLFLRERVGDTR